MEANHVHEIFEGLDQSWLDLIKVDMKATTISTIKALNAELKSKELTVESLSPSHEKILNFARGFPLSDTKVIILGQDPYPKKASATGRAFDMPKDMRPLQASVRNIYRALFKHKLIPYISTHGSLESWCKQGVVMLNTALTTKEGIANQHKDVWKGFTDELIAHLSKKLKNVVWMLWGEPAKKKAKLIDTTNGHLILQWCHPSPLVKINLDDNNPLSFLNCDHFIKCNEFLVANGKAVINWNVDTPEDKLAVGKKKEKVFKHNEKVSADTLYLFTDGSAKDNGKPHCVASHAYVLVGDVYIDENAMIDISKTKELGRGSGMVNNSDTPATNQRAELLGIYYGLANIINAEYWKKYDTCNILTDSKYSVNIISDWWEKWNAEGTLGRRANVDIITELMEFIDIVRNNFKNFRITHINSHTKPPQNTDAYFYWYYNSVVDAIATKLVYG